MNFYVVRNGLHGYQWHFSHLTMKTKLCIGMVSMELILNNVLFILRKKTNVISSLLERTLNQFSSKIFLIWQNNLGLKVNHQKHHNHFQAIQYHHRFRHMLAWRENGLKATNTITLRGTQASLGIAAYYTKSAAIIKRCWLKQLCTHRARGVA